MEPESLFAIDPTSLVPARILSHLACQWPSKAARANLPARSDDGHSNLGWMESHRALVSHPLDPAGKWQLGFSFSTQALIWLENRAINQQLALVECAEAVIADWVDARLVEADLNSTAQVAMPYQLESPNDYRGFAELSAECAALGRWFACANSAFNHLSQEFAEIAIGQPEVRCWPHHFDIAILFVLEQGDPESARSIGLGLSPGDDGYGYAEPYLYCSPYPQPNVDQLPTPSEPLHWHTEGFVSLIAQATDLESAPGTDLEQIADRALSLARTLV